MPVHLELLELKTGATGAVSRKSRTGIPPPDSWSQADSVAGNPAGGRLLLHASIARPGVYWLRRRLELPLGLVMESWNWVGPSWMAGWTALARVNRLSAPR